MEDLWPLITVVGPLLLAAVLIYAYVKNKAQPQSEVRRSEQAAHDLRDEIEREDN